MDSGHDMVNKPRTRHFSKGGEASTSSSFSSFSFMTPTPYTFLHPYPSGTSGVRFRTNRNGFCLRFGLSVTGIFVSETEERNLLRTRPSPEEGYKLKI
jgi:hypothetical protein